jgi:hypothetical protein
MRIDAVRRSKEGTPPTDKFFLTFDGDEIFQIGIMYISDGGAGGSDGGAGDGGDGGSGAGADGGAGGSVSGDGSGGDSDGSDDGGGGGAGGSSGDSYGGGSDGDGGQRQYTNYSTTMCCYINMQGVI